MISVHFFAEVTETLQNQQKLVAGGLDSVKNLHQGDTVQKVAQAVSQKVTRSVQHIVRNSVTETAKTAAPNGVLETVKNLANNSSLTKNIVEPASSFLQKLATNETKHIPEVKFLPGVARNLTRGVVVDRTKFV